MRIGINIPNDLYERFKPLRAIYNLSQVCRDAIKVITLQGHPSILKHWVTILGNVQSTCIQQEVIR
jgi:hypothetical protein